MLYMRQVRAVAALARMMPMSQSGSAVRRKVPSDI